MRLPRVFENSSLAFYVFICFIPNYWFLFTETVRPLAENPEWLEEKRRQVEPQGEAIYESDSDSQANRSPHEDDDASQGLCDFAYSNPCVFQEFGDSMSEISLFSSTPEIPEDTFRVHSSRLLQNIAVSRRCRH